MAENPKRLSHQPSGLPTGLATGRVTEALGRSLQLERLNVFIGRWITEGETVTNEPESGVQILASDVYEWVPGGHFVVHSAYGRIGAVGVGGIEIIGYDPGAEQFRTHFFDSQGNMSTETLSYRNGTWTWQGAHARCTGVFTDSGKTLTAHHERSDDGVHWVPSMIVTLRKVE
jgi:hypothetical protein